jgi:hypothetical protein
MNDWTSKIIFGAIALGLWGNLIVPLVRPVTAVAQYESDYILKSIDSRLASIEGITNGAIAAQNRSNYILQSIDGRLSNIDSNVDKLQRGACPNTKLCL